MFELAKRAHWLQTLVVRLVTTLHPAIEHNVQKTQAIKKAFYFAFLEQIAGDYLEFGVFEGTSLIAAFENDKAFRTPAMPARAFWGFDSFEGFKYFDTKDKHPFFKEGEFSSSYAKTHERLQQHIKNRAAFHLVEGYFEDSLANISAPDLDIHNISVALIDCDLGSPALLALNFMYPAMQNGMVLILDDYFAYKGSLETGVAGAFHQFQAQHPHLRFRRLFDYGHGGQGFVLADGAEKERP